MKPTTFRADPKLLEQVRQKTALINEPTMTEFIVAALTAWTCGRLAYEDLQELIQSGESNDRDNSTIETT